MDCASNVVGSTLARLSCAKDDQVGICCEGIENAQSGVRAEMLENLEAEDQIRFFESERATLEINCGKANPWIISERVFRGIPRCGQVESFDVKRSLV